MAKKSHYWFQNLALMMMFCHTIIASIKGLNFFTSPVWQANWLGSTAAARLTWGQLSWYFLCVPYSIQIAGNNFHQCHQGLLTRLPQCDYLLLLSSLLWVHKKQLTFNRDIASNYANNPPQIPLLFVTPSISRFGVEQCLQRHLAAFFLTFFTWVFLGVWGLGNVIWGVVIWSTFRQLRN